MKNLLKSWVLSGASLLVALATLLVVLVGGNSQSVPEKSVRGLTNYDEIAAGDATIRNDLITISSSVATSTGFLKNSDKFTRWVTLQAVEDATSSAQSYKVFVGTTTQPVTSITGSGSALAVPLFLTPGNAPFLNGWLLATSTNASSTDTWGPFGSAGRASDKVALLPWKPGEYLFVLLQNAFGVDLPGQFSATNTSVKPRIDVIVTTHATSTVR